MKGFIKDIYYIAGSSSDQEGGITIYFRDNTEVELGNIEFFEDGTFEAH